MSYNAIFLGWNRSIPGREQLSAEHFQEFLGYLGGLQAEGAIDSYEPVLLTPHGGDLNGFILIRGEAGKLNDLQSTETWQNHITRGGQHLEGQGVVHAASAEMVGQWMERWTSLIPA